MKVLRKMGINGKETSFRFHSNEWAAIEQAASGHSQTWQEWAAAIIDAHPDTKNRAALLRLAVLESACGRVITDKRTEFENRAMEHPMLKDRFWALDADTAKAELKNIEIDYECNFDGFTIIAGHRFDEPMVLVLSRMEGGMSAVLHRDPFDDVGEDDSIYDEIVDGTGGIYLNSTRAGGTAA